MRQRLGSIIKRCSKLNPKLIYGQITGYGSDNSRVGYDAIIQAEAGFMFMNGEPGGVSLKMPVALVDILAAHHLKEGILLAMLRMTKTGKGDFVEVSLIQAAIASLANQATNWLIGGKIPQKQGSAHPNIAPYGDVFTTSEGREILLAIGSDRQFHALCAVLEMQEVAKDRKFETNVLRVSNRVSLHKLLQRKLGECKIHDITSALNRAKIPVGVIQDLQQVFEMEEAKDLLFEAEDRIGVKTYVGSSKSNKSPHFSPPPHLGEHTAEILTKSLQMSLQDIQELAAGGVIC